MGVPAVEMFYKAGPLFYSSLLFRLPFKLQRWNFLSGRIHTGLSLFPHPTPFRPGN